MDCRTYHSDVVGRVLVIDGDPHTEEGGVSQYLLYQEEVVIDVPAGLITHVKQVPTTCIQQTNQQYLYTHLHWYISGSF